jgi:transglutaminase-like putative cysteine protease
MERYFQISCHALIISGFGALALTGRLDTPSVVIFVAGFLFSTYRMIKGLPPLVTARAAFLLSCFYVVFFLFDSMILSGSFIPATIHMVLFLELAKLFQEKTDKDYLYLIVLSFLQILAASSLTIDMSFVATLFFFLVALVSTLMSFDMYRSERHATLNAEEVAGPLSGMSLWATTWIILAGIGLFLLIPRVGTGYFSRAAVESLLMSGFNESVQLGDIGQVKLSSAVVMRATPISGSPSSIVKWRGLSLDHFDGQNWYKTDRSRTRIRPFPEEHFQISPVENTGDQLRYEILLEPLATTTLFGPHSIRSITGPVQALHVDNEEGVYLRFQSVRRVQYQVLSEVPNRRRLERTTVEPPFPPDIDPKYLQLPQDLDPRITELAQQITSAGSSTAEKASLVEAHLKRNFDYSLDLNWTPGPQPLTTFLFEAKRGHCEYFASSMAILLRSVGIPTRIVNGFLTGEYNPIGNNYIVRQSDAHSWVEVYVPGLGWAEFDPTPPDPNLREMNLLTQMSMYVDAAELFWNSYVLIYDSGTQLQLFRSAQDSVQSMQTSVRDQADEWVGRGQLLSDQMMDRLRHWVEAAWFWIAIGLLVVGAFAFNNRRKIRTWLQIRQLRNGGAVVHADVVEHMFYRAARLAERRALKRRPVQTWREWILGLQDAERRRLLTKALHVFEKSKYGRAVVSPAEFRLLEETIRELKGAR